MSLWTNLQREYVRDIEKNLGITFDRKPTKFSASMFIKEFAEANRKMRDLRRKKYKRQIAAF